MTQAVFRRPRLYPKQFAAIYAPERYSVVEASTKSGKTLGCMVWITEQALKGKPGNNFWWVAPTYQQAKIPFRRLLRQTQPPGLFVPNHSELFLQLPNETSIWFKGADKPDSLYGEDVHAAVIDEASRTKEEAWHAVRSTLSATRGPIRIIGNVRGRKNWAYNMARQAEAGEKGMAYHKITAHDAIEAGVLVADEVEDAKRSLPEAVFQELYMAEASEDQTNPFGLDAILECVLGLSRDEPAVWGWDLAKSEDWTVGIALDSHGRTCQFERWQGPWIETEQKIVNLTGKCPALVDSTGVGDPVLETLQQNGRQNFEGFKFSAPSKQQLMEGLAVAIQQRAISYPLGPIVNELKSFEYEYTRTGVRYTAPEGLHDDCVCALALAVRHRQVGGTDQSYLYMGRA